MAATASKQLPSDEDPLSFLAASPSAMSSPPGRQSASPSNSGPGGTTGSSSAPRLSFLGGAVPDGSTVRGVLESASTRARVAVSSARPWREYFDARQVSLPKFAEITERVEQNFRAFRGNYEVIAAAWVAFGLFMSLGSFLVAGLLLLVVERWVRFKIQNEGSLDISEKALACAAVLVIVWVTGVGNNVLEAFALAAVSVAFHAVVRIPPDDDLDMGELPPADSV